MESILVNSQEQCDIIKVDYDQLVDNMKKAVSKPVVDKNDLKWKAIAAAQSTCSEVVSFGSYSDIETWKQYSVHCGCWC